MGRRALFVKACTIMISQYVKTLGTALSLFGFASLPAFATPEQVVKTYHSSAYKGDTDELLYVERHDYTLQNGQPTKAVVSYFDPEGDIIAEKNLVFSASAAAPFFVRQNMKNGFAEGFLADDNTNDGVLFYQDEGQEAQCNRQFEAENVVVDAGFNQYLRSKLDELATGNKVKFDLLVPKACRAIGFEAVPVNGAGDGELQVMLRPQNFMFRLLVPETRLIYSLENKELVFYRGISDLMDDQGRRMDVTIRFDRPTIVATAED